MSVMSRTFSVLAEVEASSLFAGENINWKYCVDHATFVHRDPDACEFIFYVGGSPGDEDYAETVIEQMKKYGCTPEFIDAYKASCDAGTIRVLFYA